MTPVDAGIARPLIEGLSEPTVVTDPAGARLFDIEPIGFEAALRLAVAEDPELPPGPRRSQPAGARGGRPDAPRRSAT